MPETDKVEVAERILFRAREAAKRIRHEIRIMSPVTKALAKREIAEITLLLEAVEAL